MTLQSALPVSAAHEPVVMAGAAHASSPLVFMFPGQNSRYPGMLDKLVGLHAPNADVLAHACDILGRDLAAHYRSSNAAAFATNRDVQIGVFLANHMFLRILDDAGIAAPLSLGLSLGEYNHLVHVGALSFSQALVTVDARGQAYDAGPRGAMVSVFPIELGELEDVARRASAHGTVEVVNLNSPQQHVLSGAHEAIEEALRILEQEFFAQAVVIEQQVPMHSSRFEPVGRHFRRHLEGVDFARPRLAYLPNRLGHLIDDPGRDTFVDLLATHVHSPTHWRRSIDHLVERYPEAVFVEVGPKCVLHDLLHRKWHPNRKFHTDSLHETRAHLDGVIAALHELGSRAWAGAR